MPPGATTVALRPVTLPLRAGRQAQWELRVTNGSGRPIDLTLRSSQLGDVALERSGSTRYRWSAGRAFLQVLGERSVQPGETWTFSLEGPLDVEPGAYDAVGSVACEPPLPTATLGVVVEA